MQISSTPQAIAALEPLLVENEPGEDASAASGRPEVFEQPIGIGHLRHLDRMDERSDLDDVHSGRGEPVDPLDLPLDRDEFRLHLQAVSRSHLVHDDSAHGDLPDRSLQDRYAGTGAPIFSATASAISSVVLLPPMS